MIYNLTITTALNIQVILSLIPWALANIGESLQLKIILVLKLFSNQTFLYQYGELFCLLLLKTEINYSRTKYNKNTNPSELLALQRVKSNKQQVKNNEQGVKSNEQQAKSNKQQTKSNEHRAKGNKKHAKSNKQGAKSNKQKVTSNDQKVESSEQQAKSNE